MLFFFLSRRRHTISSTVSWARKMCIRDRYVSDAEPWRGVQDGGQGGVGEVGAEVVGGHGVRLSLIHI